MGKTLKYWEEFRSVRNTLYRVEILTDETSTTPIEVVSPYDTPIEIEWNEVDKLEPVQGACLTLSLSSKSDRQFLSLFSIDVGTVRVDVYRDGTLYWSGMLDPELYEEPYSEKQDYDVSFTFSDFAILDRLRWGKKGVCSLQEVIDVCLNASGIHYNKLEKFISTKTSAAETRPIDLSALYILCENFYDEDGEPMTLREVLDEVLRPFALRMVQKGGNIYLYDLNAVYTNMDVAEVKWADVDAELNTDKIYNNVKVVFSPYADAELIDGTLIHEKMLPEHKSGPMWLVDNDFNNAADGFSIVTGEQEDLPLRLLGDCKFFRMDSEYSGSDDAGVAYAFKGWQSLNYYGFAFGKSFPRVFSNGVNISKPIIGSESAFLGYVSYKRSDYRLRISLDVLFDVRYNPFENASRPNEEGNWGRLQDWCNFGYIPVMLYLKDSNGKILYHYENAGVMHSNSYVHGANCRWVPGTGKWGDMYLGYYNKGNRKSASGFGGWQTNQMIIGYYRDGLPKKWEKMEQGELIDLPPVGGFLEMQIGSGVHQFDYKRKEKDIYSIARWLLYRAPKVTLVGRNGIALKIEDIEDAAWVNRSAKEELEIDTILGTLGKNYCPSARGLILKSNYEAYQTFSRAGVEDRLEHLLIGTVYSQYAFRHHTLSGTTDIIPTVCVLTDASIAGKFILLSEVQNLLQETSEIIMSEFSADHFDGIEYKK